MSRAPYVCVCAGFLTAPQERNRSSFVIAANVRQRKTRWNYAQAMEAEDAQCAAAARRGENMRDVAC